MSNGNHSSVPVPSPLEEFNRDSVVINSGVGVVDSVQASAESFLFVDHSNKDQQRLDLGVVINDPFVSDSINMEQEQHMAGPFSPQDNWSQQLPPPQQHMDQDHMSFGAGPPPPSAGNERAQMWQQSHYMGGGGGGDPRVTESGFISGNNTGPSSVTGHEDADTDYLGSGAASTLYDLDSLPQSGWLIQQSNNIFKYRT